MTALDLELSIGRNQGSGYPVVARAGAETVSTVLPVSFVDPARRLDVITNALPTASAVERAAVIKAEQQVRELGQQLFEALVAGPVRELYAATRRSAEEQGDTMRMVLRIHPVELAAWPWELMFDPGHQGYLGLRLALIRYPETLAPRQPLQVTGPLRILSIVVPGQSAAEDAEEQQRLAATLSGLEDEGLVELAWVAGQTCADVADALGRGPWHAFHVIRRGGGDGPSPASIRQAGSIWQAGRCDLADSEDFCRLLAEHDTLRLVTFTALGTGSADVSTRFARTAGAVMRAGIPAMIATQFEITGPAAARFTQTLYHGVARRLPLDVGVMRARRALRLAEKDTCEWGAPVLYLRAAGGYVFTAADPPAGAPADPAGNQADAASGYDEALEAFWSEQWDQAITLLQKVLAGRPDHPDAATLLEQARHEQELATHYAQARAAAEAGNWEQAIAGFAAVAEADPANLDVRDRLEDARRQDAATQPPPAVHERPEQASPPPARPPGRAPHPRPEQVLHSRHDVMAVAFSPDGHRLATGGSKNIAQIWDTGTGRELRSVGASSWRRAVGAVAFNPDGHWLATASDDGTARIWDTTTGDQLLTITSDEPVRGLAFSPNGWRLATAGDDSTARIWDTTTGHELRTIAHDNWVQGVTFSSDGRWLATAGIDRTARVWDAATGHEFARVAHDHLVAAVAFSPDTRLLATACHDGTARICTAAEGTELVTVPHAQEVWAVAFSPDGRLLATASQDGTARIWSVADGTELATMIHPREVWDLAFSPDGRRLATVSADRTTRIWALTVPPNPP